MTTALDARPWVARSGFMLSIKGQVTAATPTSPTAPIVRARKSLRFGASIVVALANSNPQHNPAPRAIRDGRTWMRPIDDDWPADLGAGRNLRRIKRRP
jgi:hypothetical protein